LWNSRSRRRTFALADTGPWCCVGFDPVADERGDLANIEVGQQYGDDELCCGQAAHSTSGGAFDVFGAASFDLCIEGFDGVAGVGVEIFPFLAAILEGLILASVLGAIECDRSLFANFADELGEVCLIDVRACLLGGVNGEIPQWTRDRRAGADGGQVRTTRPFASGFSFWWSW
jgi:hypothetical protein